MARATLAALTLLLAGGLVSGCTGAQDRSAPQSGTEHAASETTMPIRSTPAELPDVPSDRTHPQRSTISCSFVQRLAAERAATAETDPASRTWDEPTIDLTGAGLQGCDLSSSFLRGLDLIGAQLQGATLRSADLAEARLSAANLEGADLENAVLSWAILDGATLARADLSGAELLRAEMEGADFSGAELEGAYFGLAWASNATFSSADLTNADFEGALLTGADFRDAIGLTQHQLDASRSYVGARLPAGLLPDERGRR